jgi:glycosyltransferase involved in cell wall biosynthesis
MSSRYEGFPNVLLEAMSYELPVISFDCVSGPSDIISHKENGWLVPEQAGSHGLSNAISILISDRALRFSLGIAAASVRERFSIEKIAKQWDDILGLSHS